MLNVVRSLAVYEGVLSYTRDRQMSVGSRPLSLRRLDASATRANTTTMIDCYAFPDDQDCQH